MDKASCDAFPEGIPAEILRNVFLHNKKHPKQKMMFCLNAINLTVSSGFVGFAGNRLRMKRVRPRRPGVPPLPQRFR
jgi:hypothetical protein